jgi:hypothetical protein
LEKEHYRNEFDIRRVMRYRTAGKFSCSMEEKQLWRPVGKARGPGKAGILRFRR